jgi:hypothetical protein
MPAWDVFSARERRKIIDMKRTWCIFPNCHEPDPVKLDYAHIDPTQKLGNLSNMHYGISEIDMILEMGKCIVLCKPHHQIYDRVLRTRQPFRIDENTLVNLSTLGEFVVLLRKGP